MYQNSAGYRAIIQTPIGALGICMQGQCLKAIDFLAGDSGSLVANDPVTKQVTDWLQCYLRDPHIDLPFEPCLQGTAFQQRVWRRLIQIPPGKTLTYGQLADELHTSPRAIGNACRANPCPLVVPCHRVVGNTGMGGFAGKTSGPKLQLKVWLLHHEGVLCRFLTGDSENTHTRC
jgi:methylated-DNA-[protein]-cysteine S-methyltransferase